MEWDLDILFKNQKQLQETKNIARQSAISFEEQYKGKLAKLKAEEFETALNKYEDIIESLERIMSYAYLRFASQTTEGAMLSECELHVNATMEHLLFFELEFGNLTPTQSQYFIKHAPRYAYYLSLIVENHKHQRSDAEERIILKLSPVGANAFSRLFSEHFSRLKVPLENQEYSEEEILSQLHHTKRHKRKKAARAFTQVLKKEKDLFAYILNIVRKEWSIIGEIRQYTTPEEPRHIDNQTTQHSVDTMIQVVNQNMGIVAEFYTIKKELMGYDTLYDYDRYAPLFNNKIRFDFEYSKKIVLESFQEFSPLFAEIATKAFNEQWIDSHPRENKQSGAFSHSTVPKAHPFILLNHTNNRKDVFTMAHELGHAIHQELSKKVGCLNAHTPLTTSETASVFAEMLLFDKIKNQLKGKEKAALYAAKLEDIFATLFRQTVFTNFERRIHAEQGELSAEQFNHIWQEENQKMFGDSLTLTSHYALWWSYIPHFIHSPFYCYAYSYGQLLVLALFGLYRRNQNNRAEFTQKYVEFLSAGGSRSPRELVALFGFDIESEEFWKIGIQEIHILLEEFKKIITNK
ncbi:oligoendopeptidase F [Helicobacter monodelphidis]|uniref:M3 family oligoendopeptidase n=1 Tax=Helicobacter sp. 15-1451 TaxID=2004995 RepID=UPI000DCD8376|nr:M3 family oligoendopeptidase [Helicobacter sp. 15-1451]RAX57596.1 oligoendopeptidase F [Helicobacter sp. 15-1451]